jgi:hypothetical protein
VLRGSDLKLWPSNHWLRTHGGSDLITAIDHAGGPARWAHELGLPLRDRYDHRPGQPWTPATTAAALGSLLAGRDSWPSRREFEAAGLSGLYATISKREGHRAMAAHHRLPMQRAQRQRTTTQPSPRRTSTDSSATVGVAASTDVARAIEQRLRDVHAQLDRYDELARERQRLQAALRELRTDAPTPIHTRPALHQPVPVPGVAPAQRAEPRPDPTLPPSPVT